MTSAAQSGADACIPPRLDSFPPELLLEIFSYLAPVPSRQPAAGSNPDEESDIYRVNISLRNVKAVCRSFATLVTPLITAHYCDGDFYHVRLNAQQQENWEKVKTVILDGPLYNESRYRHGSERFDHYLKLRDVDERLGLTEIWCQKEEEENDETKEVSVLDQEEWKRKYFGNFYDEGEISQSNYERAVVLCLCPNVEEVLYGSYFDDKWRRYSLDTDFTSISPIVSAARGKPFGKVHKFESLRYLSVDLQFMEIGQVISVMQLPSLQHLVLEWRSWTSMGFSGKESRAALDNWDCPDRSSSVEKLELRYTECPSAIVRRLLRSCKVLKSFSVHCLVSLGSNVREWYVDMFDELEKHASTLKELLLTSDFVSVPEYGNGAPVLGATELQRFEQLKRLRILFRLITGYGGGDNDASNPPVPDFSSMFPPLLQDIELDIYGATPYDETTSAFADLLCQKDSALQRVHVITHTRQRKEYGMPEQTYPLPMDLPSLSALSRNKSNIRFDYTLLHEGINNTSEIEWARTKMLRLPHGEELVAHATCGEERKWNELLSRPVGTPLPFRSLKMVSHEEARSRGWLAAELSAGELAEKVKEYEPKSPYISIKYNF